MFGIDGPEFLVILVVLIVVIGPKDLPNVLRAFGKATARMRATANEFRRQFDDAMREVELDEAKKSFNDSHQQAPCKSSVTPAQTENQATEQQSSEEQSMFAYGNDSVSDAGQGAVEQDKNDTMLATPQTAFEDKNSCSETVAVASQKDNEDSASSGVPKSLEYDKHSTALIKAKSSVVQTEKNCSRPTKAVEPSGRKKMQQHKQKTQSRAEHAQATKHKKRAGRETGNR